MHLSTSSSKEEQHAFTQARHRNAWQILLFGGLSLLLALLLVRQMIDWLQYELPNPFSIMRIQSAAEALPVVLHDPLAVNHKTVYFFGSSLAEFGISPEIFDHQLNGAGVPVRSYNFAYGNADPSIHKMFTAKFQRDFASSNKTIDLLVFEFAPFQATRKRELQTGQLNNAVEAVLAHPGDFWRMFLRDHNHAVAALNTRYLRDGIPAEAITNLLGNLVQEIKIGGQQKPPQVVAEKPPLLDMVKRLYTGITNYWPNAKPVGRWMKLDRGGFPNTLSNELYILNEQVMQRLQQTYYMQSSRQQRLDCCDMETLEISPAMLDDFIAALKNAEQVSRRVDLLLMPRNQDIIKLNTQGQRNLAVALQRIKTETGVRIVDFSEQPYYPVSDFLDADHLTLFDGRAKFTRQLADYYAHDPEFSRSQ